MNYDFETEIKIFAHGKMPVYVTSTLERTNLNHFWNHYNKGYDQTFLYIVFRMLHSLKTAQIKNPHIWVLLTGSRIKCETTTYEIWF